jgi:hypothetical protein
MFVFVVSTTLLLCGLTTGGTVKPWKSGGVLAPLTIGIVGLGLFIIVEWKGSKHPMVPLRIFSNRTANAGFFGGFIHGLVLWSFAYYLIIFVRCLIRARGALLTDQQFLGARGDSLFKSSAETLPGR